MWLTVSEALEKWTAIITVRSAGFCWLKPTGTLCTVAIGLVSRALATEAVLDVRRLKVESQFVE